MEFDHLHIEKRLPEPAFADFIKWLDLEFYRGASDKVLRISGAGHEFMMEP